MEVYEYTLHKGLCGSMNCPELTEEEEDWG